MPRMLDVSDEVRAEIGDEEPTGCSPARTPRAATTARPAAPRATPPRSGPAPCSSSATRPPCSPSPTPRCMPSQVVQVAEEQLQGAVRSITAERPERPDGPRRRRPPRQAVLGRHQRLILIEAAAPRSGRRADRPIARPGATARRRLPAAAHRAGLHAADRSAKVPPVLPGWSVLLAMGQLHAVLQPGPAAAARSPGGRRTSRSRSPRAGGRPPTGTTGAGVRGPGRLDRPPAPRGPAAGRAGARRPRGQLVAARCRSRGPEPVPGDTGR